MNLARNVIQSGAGAFLAGSFVGFGEAAYLASSAPDQWALVYAWVLYGLVGLGLGAAVGVVLSLVQRWIAVTDSRAFGLGAVGAAAPMAFVILRYLANKVVYLERGVPITGTLAIVAVILASSVAFLVVFPVLLRGPLAFLLRGPGVFGAWFLVGMSLLGVGFGAKPQNPRSVWGMSPAGEPSPDSFNLIFIMVDTLRADAIGTYGFKEVRTPNLDRFATESIVFEQASANASWTRASGASIFSAQLPSGHTAALKSSTLPSGVVTWPEVLQKDGVVNAALINNINLTSTFGFNQGFDSFVYESPEYPFGGTESVFALSLYKVLVKVVDRLNGESKEVYSYYQPADVVLEDAVSFMKVQKGRWSIFVHLMEPHDPYFEHPSLNGGSEDYSGVGVGRAELEKPDPSQKEHLQGLYRGEVEFLDVKLGTFLEDLRASGEYDRTMIVITADHGEEFMEHGGFWHGTSLYEEQLRVPLMIKLPKGKLAGTRVPWPVHSLDLGPTIVAQYGLAPDPSWLGHDLVKDTEAWLERTQLAPVPDEHGVVEVPVVDPCSFTWTESRIVIAEQDFEGNALASIRKDGLKFIRANKGNPRGLPEASLFRLTEDPVEATNLASGSAPICGANPQVVKERLQEDLDLAISVAKARGVSGEKVKIGDTECARMKSLGYLDDDAPCEE